MRPICQLARIILLAICCVTVAMREVCAQGRTGDSGDTVLDLGSDLSLDSALVCDATLFFSEGHSGEVRWMDFSGASGRAQLKSNAHVVVRYCLGEGRVVVSLEQQDFVLFDSKNGETYPLGKGVVKAKRGVLYLSSGSVLQQHKSLPSSIRIIHVASLKKHLRVDPDLEWAFNSGAPLALTWSGDKGFLLYSFSNGKAKILLRGQEAPILFEGDMGDLYVLRGQTVLKCTQSSCGAIRKIMGLEVDADTENFSVGSVVEFKNGQGKLCAFRMVNNGQISCQEDAVFSYYVGNDFGVFSQEPASGFGVVVRKLHWVDVPEGGR